MRHYEIVFLVHPDQSEQVPAMVERYKTIVTAGGGQMHRLEDWGRRQLTHMIGKAHKAHYVLMNIECTKPALDELTDAFRFNDAILRHLVISRDAAVISPSFLAKSGEEDARDATPRAQAGSREPVSGDSMDEAAEEVAEDSANGAL